MTGTGQYKWYDTLGRAVFAGLLAVLLSVGGGNVHAQDDSPVDFEADSVTVSNERGVMIATGNVKVTQEGETLYADKIIYNRTNMAARAVGNVRIITKEGIIHSSDEMALDQNFTHAIATPLMTRFADGTTFSAASGDHKKDIQTVFDRSVFSPCKCDYDSGESPIWDLRATRSTHDRKSQTITHENVVMRVLGLPVFFLPALVHPDGTVARESGFLTPRLAYSEDKGMTATTPYFHVIDKSTDIEFQPTNFQRRGNGLKTIYRQRWDESDLDLILYSAEVETFKKDREQVAAIDANYKTRIGQGWMLDMRLNRTSQDTFLRRYGYVADDQLDSYVRAEKLTNTRYYRVEASDTQGLKAGDTADFEPLVLPSVFYEKISAGPFRHQTVRQQFSALQLDNDEGHELVRWTGLVGSAFRYDLGGHIFSASGDLLGSYHDIQATDNPSDKLSTIGQGHVVATAEWQYPFGVVFGKEEKTAVIIAPKIKAIGIEGSDRTDRIPNRDAADFRLDEANLFLNNRFQGRDYMLPGTEIASGISAAVQNPFIGDVSGFAGLSYRATGTSSSEVDSDSRDRYSDYVTSFSLRTPNALTLEWSGRADRRTLKLNESVATAAFDGEKTDIALTHTQLAQSYFTDSADDREEATLTFSQALGGGLTLTAEQVWNLSSKEVKRDQSIMSLGWAGGFQDCLSVSLDYKRDPYADRDIKRVNEVQLLLTFKYLGSLTQ